jgi:glycosyltransferase involved in cell wall biosynthesis
LDQLLKNHFSGSRFLLVIGQYGKLGGAERQALVLADQLKNQVDCQVDFLAWGGEGRVTQELNKRGIKAWVFALHWNSSPYRRILKLWQLARFIKQEIKPDYLLPYIGFNCKIIGLIWRRTGARYTWWNQRDEGREVYGSHLERHVINSVPDVVSNSYEGRDFLAHKFGLSPDLIHVINNGVVLPTRSNREVWREKLGLGEEDILIIMVAHLTTKKDHVTLLKAFSLLVSGSPVHKYHLLLVGMLYETTEQLKALAFDLGLCQFVHFVGEITSVTDCYSAADIAVHSSTFEGCPNAVLEAMSHRLPVCGTNISGMRQALGDGAALDFLVPPADVESLCGAMQKLGEDPILRKSAGDRNFLRVESFFSAGTLATNILSLIRKHD